MFYLPQVGTLPLLLPHPRWLSHNLCNRQFSGLALPGVLPPKSNWIPYLDQFPVMPPASPPPPPSGFPHYHLAFINHVPLRNPHVTPAALCSHEVGKDSLKCSTSSKWVHFSCLLPDPCSLSQNLYRWLHHGLELPCLSQWGPCLSHPPASFPPPRLSSSAPSPSHPPPPTNMFTCSGFISTSPFTPSPP